MQIQLAAIEDGTSESVVQSKHSSPAHATFEGSPTHAKFEGSFPKHLPLLRPTRHMTQFIQPYSSHHPQSTCQRGCQLLAVRGCRFGNAAHKQRRGAGARLCAAATAAAGTLCIISFLGLLHLPVRSGCGGGLLAGLSLHAVTLPLGLPCFASSSFVGLHTNILCCRLLCCCCCCCGCCWVIDARQGAVAGAGLQGRDVMCASQSLVARPGSDHGQSIQGLVHWHHVACLGHAHKAEGPHLFGGSCIDAVHLPRHVLRDGPIRGALPLKGVHPAAVTQVVADQVQITSIDHHTDSICHHLRQDVIVLGEPVT
mmetsp:Transcript_28947/g.77984  ORF Transcript_28947/g.77984 Transcript_28947/m.77984 type:complete len:312 (-) Transcript_28947:1053-1988(-)